MHTIIGEDILKDFTVLPDIKDGAKYHHERFNEGGYPNGLKEQDIPLCARIICVADSYDAMASDRHYRKKLDYDMIKALPV
ncbi:Cyclic di-GMP phosphodiesterase [anaerobic digester metagenome]